MLSHHLVPDLPWCDDMKRCVGRLLRAAGNRTMPIPPELLAVSHSYKEGVISLTAALKILGEDARWAPVTKDPRMGNDWAFLLAGVTHADLLGVGYRRAVVPRGLLCRAPMACDVTGAGQVHGATRAHLRMDIGSTLRGTVALVYGWVDGLLNAQVDRSQLRFEDALESQFAFSEITGQYLRQCVLVSTDASARKLVGCWADKASRLPHGYGLRKTTKLLHPSGADIYPVVKVKK